VSQQVHTVFFSEDRAKLLSAPLIPLLYTGCKAACWRTAGKIGHWLPLESAAKGLAKLKHGPAERALKVYLKPSSSPFIPRRKANFKLNGIAELIGHRGNYVHSQLKFI
jgi:hypothetical protein